MKTGLSPKLKELLVSIEQFVQYHDGRIYGLGSDSLVYEWMPFKACWVTQVPVQVPETDEEMAALEAQAAGQVNP